MYVVYPLHPNTIVLFFGFFGPEMIVWFICLTINLRLKVEYFRAKFSISKSLLTLQLSGCFKIVVVFYFKSHTYL